MIKREVRSVRFGDVAPPVKAGSIEGSARGFVYALIGTTVIIALACYLILERVVPTAWLPWFVGGIAGTFLVLGTLWAIVVQVQESRRFRAEDHHDA